MTLLLTMLPVYLFGNLHCIGMCGPLVMMIGAHRFRYFYFLGRTLSFTLAGAIAGYLGAVLELTLKHYEIPAAASLLFGGMIIFIGTLILLKVQMPQLPVLGTFSRSLSLLLLKDQPWPTFLFGLFTIALPCGQTVLVFTACALAGGLGTGLINGCAFALLTSPSLLIAMHSHRLLVFGRQYYHSATGVSALIVGIIAICRGLADLGWISHWILNPHAHEMLHIVVF